MHKNKKKLLVLGTLVVGALVSLACWAYPQPAPNAEVYVTYYRDASRTEEIGVKFIGKGYQCEVHHTTWGSQSAYSSVSVAPCLNDAPPPITRIE